MIILFVSLLYFFVRQSGTTSVDYVRSCQVRIDRRWLRYVSRVTRFTTSPSGGRKPLKRRLSERFPSVKWWAIFSFWRHARSVVESHFPSCNSQISSSSFIRWKSSVLDSAWIDFIFQWFLIVWCRNGGAGSNLWWEKWSRTLPRFASWHRAESFCALWIGKLFQTSHFFYDSLLMSKIIFRQRATLENRFDYWACFNV